MAFHAVFAEIRILILPFAFAAYPIGFLSAFPAQEADQLISPEQTNGSALLRAQQCSHHRDRQLRCRAEIILIMELEPIVQHPDHGIFRELLIVPHKKCAFVPTAFQPDIPQKPIKRFSVALTGISRYSQYASSSAPSTFSSLHVCASPAASLCFSSRCFLNAVLAIVSPQR